MPASPQQATCAQPTPATKRLRRVKFGLVKGHIYARIVEYTQDGRERTIAWLGRSPSESRIRRAAHLFRAKLPHNIRRAARSQETQRVHE